jgi:hypothetical protein
MSARMAKSSSPKIEILAPPHMRPQETVVCLCCQRYWPMQLMDEDGCGICDECLGPGFTVEEFTVGDEANRGEGNSILPMGAHSRMENCRLKSDRLVRK